MPYRVLLIPMAWLLLLACHPSLAAAKPQSAVAYVESISPTGKVRAAPPALRRAWTDYGTNASSAQKNGDANFAVANWDERDTLPGECGFAAISRFGCKAGAHFGISD